MIQVNITGNSHVGALRRGLKSIGETPGLSIEVFGMGSGRFETDEFSFAKGNEVHFSVEEHREQFSRSTNLPYIPHDDTVWGIIKALHNARVYRDEMWKTYEPSGLPVGLEQVVSDGVLMQIIDRDFVNIRKFMMQLKEAGIRCFAISAPHPRPDHTCIANGTKRELVAYIDRRYRAYVTECFAQDGIDVILPPPETYDRDGFLKPEFGSTRPGDSHHANREFGTLMMRQVVEYLNKRFLSPAGR